jgi:Fur family ferric uptake transcriptional regulator
LSRNIFEDALEASARFEQFLTHRRLRMTRERREVLDGVLAARGHFEVDELLALLRASGSRVSRATLYRTLTHLVTSGLVHRIEMERGQARYEPMFGRHHHDHLVCLSCGKIIEFESAEIERLQEEVCRRKKFVMTGHIHQIRGACSACSAAASRRPGAIDRSQKAPRRGRAPERRRDA